MALLVQLQRPRKVSVRNFPGHDSIRPFCVIDLGAEDGGTVQLFITELVDLDFLQHAVDESRAYLEAPEVRAAS